jgi:hypothetical protein
LFFILFILLSKVCCSLLSVYYIVFLRLSRSSLNFQPALTIYGDKKVVIIVIAPIIGRTKELVTPILLPTFAVTRASSPPEEERLKAVLIEVVLSKP